MASPLLHASPASGFDDAGRLALKHLYDEIGFASCLLTRIEGDDWIVLQAHGPGDWFGEGDVRSYADSLCARMVQGHGPCVAIDVAAVEPYAGAPLVAELGVAAYVGVPITWESGMLFGTLCAFDPRPAAAIVEHALPLLRLLSRLLGTIVLSEMREHAAQRRDEGLDLMTARHGRPASVGTKAWERALAHEERRCRTLGSSASVIAVRGSGDEAHEAHRCCRVPGRPSRRRRGSPRRLDRSACSFRSARQGPQSASSTASGWLWPRPTRPSLPRSRPAQPQSPLMTAWREAIESMAAAAAAAGDLGLRPRQRP